jgi:hypothetical protein
MTSYKVNATITVEVTNPAALSAIGAAGGGDERAGIEAALRAGLKELPGGAQRYGFRIVDSSATVDPA